MNAAPRRFTIGLLSENSNYASETFIVQGIEEAAEQAGVNFIYLGYFGINSLQEDTRFESEEHSNERLSAKFEQLRESIELYELDGLLIIGWSKDVQGARLEQFRRVVRGLPVVSLGTVHEGMPSLLVRGYAYVYEATKHLIEHHGRRRVAVIEPWIHDSRVEGYRAAIRDAGLNTDDIVVKYDEIAEVYDSDDRTERALRILLDERKAPIDALVVFSATEGKFALQELQRRGLRVPDDIALVCYEDELSLRFASVPLTTVYYPYREIGYLGSRTLIRMLLGESVEAEQIVPARVLYRNSCGCNRCNLAILKKLELTASPAESGGGYLEHLPWPSVGQPEAPGLDRRQLSGLFREAAQTGRYAPFLNVFRTQLLEMRLNPEQDPRILESELVESFIGGMLPAIREDEALRRRVEEICTHIRDIVEIKEKTDMFRRIETEQLLQHALSHIGKALLSSYELEAVLNLLNDYMGWIQVPTLYLFQNSDRRNGLIFGFQNYYNMTSQYPERADMRTVFRQYKAVRQERFTLVILPLHINREPIGCAWMDPGRNHAGTLVTLSDYIKSAIKGCMLFEESQMLINQIQETKELLESYIQHTDDGIVVMCCDGNIIRVNDAVRRIFGWDESELVGRHIAILNPVSLDIDDVRQRLASGYNLNDIETPGKRKDGRPVDLSLTLSPIRNRNGVVTAIALLFRDVTESKKTDEYLRKLDKLSVVGQLAAGLAHEIRNPLTPLKGFTQMLREECEHRKPIFDIMLSELERIDTIVGDFLMVAKPQVSVRSSIRLHDLVRNVMKFLEPQSLLHGVVLRMAADDASAIAEIDGSDAELKQVFVNLIKNGIEAMPGGGKIAITMAVHAAGHLTTTIEDQGVGIPREKLAMIGEPFYTTKDTGTGLGMMMCYKIIQAHGGQLYIRSEEGRGTTVEVVLPLRNRHRK